MRVLVTNDDGWDSAGIGVLASVADACGLKVVVAAPAWNSSGASASITGVADDGRLAVEQHRRDDVAGLTFLGIEAAPAMIVRAALEGLFGPPPQLVLSGVNDGPNVGRAILHSGTVGAALTAATHGCRALAFSLAADKPPDYRAAAHVARRLIRWAGATPGPLTLNVNVPSCSAEELRGIRHASLAEFGAAQTTITERDRGARPATIDAIRDTRDDLGTDTALLAAGWATVTALRPACEATDADLDGLTG